jgi:hypothetical protein
MTRALLAALAAGDATAAATVAGAGVVGTGKGDAMTAPTADALAGIAAALFVARAVLDIADGEAQPYARLAGLRDALAVADDALERAQRVAEGEQSALGNEGKVGV